MALLVLGSYYTVPAVQEAFNALAQFKARWGIAFIVPAQAFAVVILPYLLQRFQGGERRRTEARHLPFLMLVFSSIGIMNDQFYGLLAYLFGNNANPSTIIFKVLVDQLVYSAFVTNPIAVLAFSFKDHDFSWARTRQNMGAKWYRNRVLPVYTVAVAVWAPAVAILYALPLALQYPFQVLVQCLWGLMLVVLTAAEVKTVPADEMAIVEAVA